MAQQQPEGDDPLERAFDLIKSGKSKVAEGQHWDAAESFQEARVALDRLAEEQPTENEEEEKIKKLYTDQSFEYLGRSRESLIEAMQQEAAMDKKEGVVRCQALSDEEARKRNDIFASIFSKPIQQQEQIIVATDDSKPDGNISNKKVLEKQLSLEERLSQLNANLPKGCKSSIERIQDLNQGMKRLGLGAYTTTANNNTSNPLKIEPPRSASQQVEDIIAQAKDEVAMDVPDSANHDDAPDNGTVGSLSEDGDDDYLSDDGMDSILSDEAAELQNVNNIKGAVATTQSNLAELLALMEHLGGEEGNEEGKSGTNNEDNDDFDPKYAKQKLKDAKVSLQKAFKLWKVKAKPR